MDGWLEEWMKEQMDECKAKWMNGWKHDTKSIYLSFLQNRMYESNLG